MDERYRIKGDMHTHTVASQHAFSTIAELIGRSKSLGMEFLAATDHGPEMTDGANRLHFLGLSRLPDVIDGIRLFKGAEVNIKNFKGRIDLDNSILKKRKSKKRYKLADRFNVTKSKEMFILIQSYHNPQNNVEKAIRSWNGGPRYSRRGTQKYYNKVMKLLK